MSETREIPARESLSVEFKSDMKKLPDEALVEAVVALSNTDGGLLYIGVEDDGTPTGLDRAHSDTIGLAALIANKTTPPVSARTSIVTLDSHGAADPDGVPVVVVEVSKSRAIVATSDGKVLRRRLKADGTPESVPLYPYEIITRLSTIGQLDYSAFPVTESTMDDLSPEEISRLREILGRSRGADQALLELPAEEMLSALRMTATVDGSEVPTVTGILLVGKPEAIARIMPTAGATFQVLEGTEVRVNQDVSLPLVHAIEKMRELFEPWNPEREFEDGLFRRSVPEFDVRAFREALVNAFGHRDYAAMGRVRVLVDDEGLTIANPGGFIEGVTVDNLLTVEPRGRNECLMTALKRIGLAERTGRGVDRIYEGSLAYGRPLPDYSGSTSANVSVFMARSAPDAAFMRMVEDEQRRTGRPLSLRSLLVLDALRRQRRLTVGGLCGQLNLPEGTVRATVESLVEAGLVEARGTSGSRSYILSDKAYRASGREADYVRQSDIDSVRYPELILKLARKRGGTVATRDVADLLHLQRQQARRLLQGMVESGELERRGKGSATHYVLKDGSDGRRHGAKS